MDPLSLTANLAAVIGLIDTICRIGKETYQLIAAVKNVPAEIQHLQGELREVEFLLRNVHRYCDEYQARIYSEHVEKSAQIVHIYSTLQTLQDEYNEIAAVVAKNLAVNPGRTRQKLKMIGGRVKLVLGGKLERSFRNLERCKGQLSINLQLLGSFNDLAVHDRLDTIHDAVSGLKGSRMISVSTDEKLPAWTERNHALPNLPYSLEAIDSLMAQLSAMRCTIEQKDDSGISSDGWDSEHVQHAALPLMLLQSKVREALQSMTTPKPGYEKLSTLDVQWVRTELENLLAASHEKAAVAIRSQNQIKIGATYKLHGHRHAVTNIGIRRNGQQKNKIVSSQFMLQDSPAGKVSIRVQWTKDAETESARVSDILLLLAPNAQMAQDGLLVSLSRLHDGLTKPVISRHISTYMIVEPTSPVFACVEANDIHTLRRFFKARDFAPTVRNTDNESLLSYAARLLRFEICELLLNEGADPNHCRSDGANAIYDIRNAFWYRHTNTTIHKATLTRILRLFITAGCDINAVALGGNPLHFTTANNHTPSPPIPPSEISALINLLICVGCDLEHRNADGLTPLLYNASLPGPHGPLVLHELLHWGANPHATTHRAEGALHLALAFAFATHAGAGPDALHARLTLLLRAGCAPSLVDAYGHTPSDFALGGPRVWFQWCLSVEMVGLSMVEILREEGVSSPVVSPVENSVAFCTDKDHIFLDWVGFFPWSVPPRCADCGLLCARDDVERRKWDAWVVFRGLRNGLV